MADLTISSLANICNDLSDYQKDQKETIEKFRSNFRTPGHVPILISSKGLLNERKGHTEMSIFLTKIADMTNVTTICEMLIPTVTKPYRIRMQSNMQKKTI